MASKIDLSEILNESLKCKLCGSGPKAEKPHWYHCTGLVDHQICQDCKEIRLSRKCSCGEEISESFCALTEKILKLDLMQFKCRNVNRGCKETPGGKTMIEHEAECISRLVQCPHCNCQSEVPFKELLDHMTKQNHFRNGFVKQGKQFTYTSEIKAEYFEKGRFNYMPRKFQFDERVFFLTGRHYGETLHFWIHLVGSKYEAKNFCYNFELHGTNPNTKTSFVGEVLPIDETTSDILRANKCFGIKYDIFKTQFTDEDRKYKISICMRNMKAEVKDDNEESGISDDE